MIFYHVQIYDAFDNEWSDIPHVNGGCSDIKEEAYETYDYLINLTFTKVSEYRIILSGSDIRYPIERDDIPLYHQFSLF